MSHSMARTDYFKNMETAELQDIWAKNDRSAWSEEAFETIRSVLRERGIDPPPQIIETATEPEYKTLRSESLAVEFRKLWKGEVALVVAYWAYGVLGNIALRVLAIFAPPLPVVQIPLVCLALAYLIVTSVGIWRSAGRYSGQKIWAVLARIVVAVNVIFLVGAATIIVFATFR